MISGRTELYCILADPVAHVRTPQLFNEYARSTGRDAVLFPLHVTRDELARAVAGLRAIRNLRCIVVTIPHKIAIVELCDELDDSARRVGAANVVRREPDGRLTGANFDGAGFVGSLEAAVGPVAGRTIHVAGAGGVARAIAFECARAGAAGLTLSNRSAQKADELLSGLGRAFPRVALSRIDIPPTAQIAINATSLGLGAGDPLPFALDELPRDAVVADVVMQPPITRLLLEAQRRGLGIVPGEGMLKFQLPAWIEFAGRDTGPGDNSGAAPLNVNESGSTPSTMEPSR